MRMNPLFALALILPVFASCDKQESGIDPMPGTIPVSFGVATGQPESRGSDLTTDNITSVGVFASYTGATDWGVSSTPNFMYNQRVERANASSSWGYTPVKYWPNNAADRISFFAYAPYTDEKKSGGSNPSFTGNTAGGYPVLTYTVPPAENAQTDLLAAAPLMNQRYATSNGKVAFQMNHALTKVTIYVKSNDKMAGKKVTAFSLLGVKGGKLTYHATTGANDKGSTWSYPAPAVKETFTATNTNFAVPDTDTAEPKQLAAFFLLPRGDGNTFSLTYTTPGTTVETITLTNQPLPSLDQWTPGTSISYTFGIEKKKITVTASVHPTWENGGSGTVVGSVVITYASNPTAPGWGNNGSGTVDGQAVVTHTEQGGDMEWESGGSESVEGK